MKLPIQTRWIFVRFRFGFLFLFSSFFYRIKSFHLRFAKMIKCKWFVLGGGKELTFHRSKAPVDLYAYLKLLHMVLFLKKRIVVPCSAFHFHFAIFIHFYLKNLSILFYFAHNISIKSDFCAFFLPLFRCMLAISFTHWMCVVILPSLGKIQFKMI